MPSSSASFLLPLLLLVDHLVSSLTLTFEPRCPVLPLRKYLQGNSFFVREKLTRIGFFFFFSFSGRRKVARTAQSSTGSLLFALYIHMSARVSAPTISRSTDKSFLFRHGLRVETRLGANGGNTRRLDERIAPTPPATATTATTTHRAA